MYVPGKRRQQEREKKDDVRTDTSRKRPESDLNKDKSHNKSPEPEAAENKQTSDDVSSVEIPEVPRKTDAEKQIDGEMMKDSVQKQDGEKERSVDVESVRAGSVSELTDVHDSQAEATGMHLPDSTVSESVSTEDNTALPDSTVPDTSLQESTVQESVVSDIDVQDDTVQDFTVPDSTTQETIAHHLVEQDSDIADSSVPESTMPDCTMADSTTADSTVPDSAIPETEDSTALVSSMNTIEPSASDATMSHTASDVELLPGVDIAMSEDNTDANANK